MLVMFCLTSAAQSTLPIFTPSLVPNGPVSNSVTLAWDPSPSPVVGYEIYRGPAPGGYTNATDVGNVTNVTLTGLKWGATYYFAATAHDGVSESDFSNEIKYTVPNVPQPLLIAEVERIRLSWESYADVHYELQWSVDGTLWQTYAYLQFGTNATAKFLVTNDAPKKLWRVKM